MTSVSSIVPKPYNLTYFITFITIAMFTDHKYIHSHRKPYKMRYIADFITYSVAI